MTGTDVIVVGAGVIGLAIAWRTAQQGRSVTVVDPHPGAGASWTAAGMLAPATELYYGEHELYALNQASVRRYPDFVAELEQFTGRQVGLRTEGTILTAWDGADVAALVDLHAFHSTLGDVATSMLSARELRALEPAVAPGLPGGLFAPGDFQIDNRLLHTALRYAVDAAAVTTIAARAAAIRVENGNVCGVTLEGGERLDAPAVVLAGGAWSRQIEGLPADVLPAVRPVKGQTLRVRSDGPHIVQRTVRATVKGHAVYVVPRADGRLVIGASSEETGFDIKPRVGAIHDLLRDAIAIVPELAQCQWEEVSTSLRPGSPDNGPLIGATSVQGLIIATGHYRNGILLTPITADAVSALLIGAQAPEGVSAFAPDRFVERRFAKPVEAAT